MESMVSFWKNKKVFITGHTGFKGSWLSLWLQRLGAHVVGFALAPPTPKNLFTEAKVADGLTDIRGDIRNFEKLHQALVQYQPEFIFHLAAQPLVKYSYSHPVETYSTNVMGTVHLLEAARQCSNLRVIVNVTTDKCYENKESDRAYQEIEPLGGFDPYSSSKACSELITNAYRNSFFSVNSKHKVGLASARAGNVIGGGDWGIDRLVPDIISAYYNKQELQIRYPNAVRPWQHVLESLSGYLRLAELLYAEPEKFAEAWNFGPNEKDAKSVAWIVTNVLKVLGGDLKWQQVIEPQAHEATLLKLDSSKAHTKLNWMPKWDVECALAATISWYKDYYNGADAREITCQQIHEFGLAISKDIQYEI